MGFSWQEYWGGLLFFPPVDHVLLGNPSVLQSMGLQRVRDNRVTDIGKNSESGRDWGQEEKGTTEDEMAGWHH